MSRRHVEVDGTTYKYVVGHQFLKVDAVGAISLAKLLGISSDEFDRARHKGSGYEVTPADVVRYIKGEVAA